jgi:ACS family sodium-dependent inorganic phosphate cotransporter
MDSVEADDAAGWPRRYTMMGLMLVALLLCYVDRVLISVAGIEMQRELGWSDSRELGWSDSDKGLVFSTFFLGYLCMQVGGGILANRFGGRNVFVIAVLGWSVLTILTPMAAYEGFAVLIAARFLLGFSEGAAYPSAYSLVYSWMPSGEVSRSISLIGASGAVGTVFALLVVGKLIGMWGWPSVFYIFGSLGVVWCVFWLLLLPASPELSGKADGEDNSAGATSKPAIPWKQLVLHRSVLPLYLVSVAFGCISFTLASWLPSYFVDTFELGLTEAGTYSILPWIAVALMAVWAGSLADRWIGNGQDRLAVRKKLVAFGMAGAAVGCVLLAVSSHPLMAVLSVSFAYGALGFTVPGYLPVAGELFPRHGAILFGFLSAFASIFSAIVVALTGVVLDVTGSYSVIWVFMAVFCVVGLVVFQAMASVTPVLPEDQALVV